MASSGFPTRKQEYQYDETIHLAFELLTFKVMELMKICDLASIDMDQSAACSHEHMRWLCKFFDVFRVVYKMEKHRYQEPKFFEAFKPLVKFLRDRQRRIRKVICVSTENNSNQTSTTTLLGMQNKQAMLAHDTPSKTASNERQVDEILMKTSKVAQESQRQGLSPKQKSISRKSRDDFSQKLDTVKEKSPLRRSKERKGTQSSPNKSIRPMKSNFDNKVTVSTTGTIQLSQYKNGSYYRTASQADDVVSKSKSAVAPAVVQSNESVSVKDQKEVNDVYSEAGLNPKLQSISSMYNPRTLQTTTNQNLTMTIYHQNQKYTKLIPADMASVNSFSQVSRARSQQNKRPNANNRANSNVRSVMRTLAQKNNAEKRMSHANFVSGRGKYEIRENPQLTVPILSKNYLKLHNTRGFDFSLRDEPFARSCTAQDYMQRKNHPDPESISANSNANSNHKEYNTISNAFTNQGLSRFTTSTRSAQKGRPSTQQNDRINNVAVFDAYNSPHTVDLLNSSIVSNNKRDDKPPPDNNQNKMNLQEAYSESVSIVASKPHKHYKIDQLLIEDSNGKYGDSRQMSVSPLKDSFLKSQSRSRKEVIYAWSMKNSVRGKRTSEAQKESNKPPFAGKHILIQSNPASALVLRANNRRESNGNDSTPKRAGLKQQMYKQTAKSRGVDLGMQKMQNSSDGKLLQQEKLQERKRSIQSVETDAKKAVMNKKKDLLD